MRLSLQIFFLLGLSCSQTDGWWLFGKDGNNETDIVAKATCTSNYIEMVTLHRLKQVYGCEEHYRKEEMTDACTKSSCFKQISKDGEGRAKCSLLSGDTREIYPDEVECLMETTGGSCGWGVYGPSVGGDRNTRKCACQILQAEIEEYVVEAGNTCPEMVTSMLCIPNMVQSIAACSWPGIYASHECVERRMDNGHVRGASIPGCYLHSCNYMQNLFNIQLPNCVCSGRQSKKEWKKREWFVFENQKQETSNVQRHEIIAARDISMKPTPSQVMLKDALFTDFADPQTCTRFVRCFDNGPCFNSTDGGYCPSGEHFHVNEDNPAENGCYPWETVDCKTVPVTNDSPGKVPVCFTGNDDFSDVADAGDSDSEYLGQEITGFRVSVNNDGYVGSIQFQYHGVWATRHGALNDELNHPATELLLLPSEHISRVAGQTINMNTIDQQVASLTLTIVDRISATPREYVYGYVNEGVPSTPWGLSYPPDMDPLETCPMKYACGGKTYGRVQVLTVHWHECLYSSNNARTVMNDYHNQTARNLHLFQTNQSLL